MSKHCPDCRLCRQRDRLTVIVSGSATGGYLLAWLGIPWVFVGMALGALVGYLVNRCRPDPPADPA